MAEMKKKAPNTIGGMVLGICSCAVALIPFMGVASLACGIVGLILSNKAMATFNENPEMYDGGGMIKAGKICSIVGIPLSGVLFMLYCVAMFN